MGWKSNKFQEFTINFLAIISLSGFLEGDQLDEMIDGKKDSAALIEVSALSKFPLSKSFFAVRSSFFWL